MWLTTDQSHELFNNALGLFVQTAVLLLLFYKMYLCGRFCSYKKKPTAIYTFFNILQNASAKFGHKMYTFPNIVTLSQIP